MYIVASTEGNDSFPYGNLDLNVNQTLASNHSDVDQLSCLYEHIYALVIKIFIAEQEACVGRMGKLLIDLKSI